jgi:hypothetical protein
MSGNGEDGTYPRRSRIEAEVGVFVERAGAPGEILEFGLGNIVYSMNAFSAFLRLGAMMSCERYVVRFVGNAASWCVV